MAHGTYNNPRAGSTSSKTRMDRLTKRWDKRAERNDKITKNEDGNYTKEVAGGAQLKNIRFDEYTTFDPRTEKRSSKVKKNVKRSEYRGLDAAAKKGKIGALAHKLAGGQDMHNEISHDMGEIGGSGINRLRERFTGPKEDRKFWKGVHKSDRQQRRFVRKNPDMFN
jgi:hypothetical protein